MRSLGAIVLGVSAYQYEVEVVHAPKLKYTVKDADAITEYLESCWPEESGALVITIPETRADLGELRKAFAELAAAGPYDLLLIYLSGHGFASAPTPGFILQPNAAGGLSLATAEELDLLLSSVKATRTAFMLDCCYAEAVISGMQFFKSLDGSEARLFVGSSRADQLTWEDDEAEHGVFTAHLVDMLNGGGAIRSTIKPDQVEIDSELFPFLCDQVPLYVLDHKQAKQEPVKGGISSSAMTLPTGRIARRIKQRTAFGTALRRLRQIATTAALSVLVALGLTYVLVYYAQVDRNGEIVLRSGTRLLEPVFRYLPTLRVRTGLDVSMLSPDTQSRYPLQSGEIAGIWTHVSPHGEYRAWYDALRDFIEPRERESLDTLVGNTTAKQIRGDPKDARPSDIEAAARTLFAAPDEKTVAWVLGGIPGGDRLHPVVSDFDPNNLDFTILDLNPQQISSYAKALLNSAAADPDRTLPVYVGFLKAAQEWLHASNDLKRRADLMERAVDEIGSVLPVIAAARKDRGEPALDESTTQSLLELSKRGYFETAGAALARTPGLEGSIRASLAKTALSGFKADLFDPAQLEALHVLTSMLDGSTNAKDIVSTVTRVFKEKGSVQDSYLTKFWIDAADARALPPDVLGDLTEQAAAAANRQELEFFDNELARVLAHAMADVPEEKRGGVYRLIDRVGTSITPMSGTMAEIYGALGRNGCARPGMLEKVIGQLEQAASRRREEAADDDKLPAMQITVGGTGPWAWALAAFGQKEKLSPAAVGLLRRVALVVPFKIDVELAIVKQADFGARRKEDDPVASLANSPTDSQRRNLEADLLALAIARLPSENFNAAIAGLLQRRKDEVETEVRIALGQAVAGARSRRYSPVRRNNDDL
jgi:hypothetical protein